MKSEVDLDRGAQQSLSLQERRAGARLGPRGRRGQWRGLWRKRLQFAAGQTKKIFRCYIEFAAAGAALQKLCVDVRGEKATL